MPLVTRERPKKSPKPFSSSRKSSKQYLQRQPLHHWSNSSCAWMQTFCPSSVISKQNHALLNPSHPTTASLDKSRDAFFWWIYLLFLLLITIVNIVVLVVVFCICSNTFLSRSIQNDFKSIAHTIVTIVSLRLVPNFQWQLLVAKTRKAEKN